MDIASGGIGDRRGLLSQPGSPDGADVHVNDVSQGGWGDCYKWAAVIQVINERPQTFDEIMDQVDDDSFTVKLYAATYDAEGNINGVENNQTTYNIDLDLTRGNSMADLSGDHKDGKAEVWTFVLEEAFAQMLGGWDELAGGSSYQAYQSIVGPGHESTYEDVSGDTSQEILNKIKAATDAGKRVVIGTPDNFPDGSSEYEIGPDDTIYGDHAYPISPDSSGDIYQTDPASGDITHVHFYNPWGADSEHVWVPVQHLDDVAQSLQIMDW